LGKDEILDFVRVMKAKDHVIMFYTDRRDKRLILFTYLKAGLDNGEAAIYVAGDESPNQIKKAMEEFGLNVRQYEKTCALNVMDYRDWYMTKGKFDIGNTISLWKKSFDQAMARGFKGLRVAGEMGFFFKHGMINELVVYERSLHRELETPLEAICAYDDTLVVKGAEEQHYLRLYLDLIVAHKITLFIGPEEAGVIRTT
jgi:hypothetical protein